MDFLKTPDDNTSIVRIMDDLDSFIARPRATGDHGITGRSGRYPNDGFIGRLDFDTSGCAAPKRKHPDTGSELLQAKCKIAHLENQVTSLEHNQKRTALFMDNASDNNVQKLLKKEDEVKELKEQLKFIAGKEDLATERLRRTEKESKTNKVNADAEISKLKKENDEYSHMISEAEQSYSTELAMLQQRVARMSQENLYTENKLAETEAMLQQNKRFSSESITVKMENRSLAVKLAKLEAENKEMQMKLSTSQDAEDVVRLMQTQIPRLKELERENGLLRQDNQLLRDNRSNALLLREKLTSLQRNYDKARESLNLMRRLEIENEDLRSKISKWESEDIGGENRKPRSPVELAQIISELQKKQIDMTTQRIGLQNSISVKDSLLAQLSEKFKVQKEDLLEVKRKEKPQVDQIKALQRKLLHATTERDGIRHILASYDQQDSSDSTPQLNIRVKEAEEQVSAGNKQIDILENELEALQKERWRIQAEKDKLCEQVKQLEDKITSKDHTVSPINSEEFLQLQKRNGALQEQVDILEARIEQRQLQGDFDPTKTKVIHLAKNPMAVTKAICTQEMERLRDENEKLHRKVRKLQSGLDVSTVQGTPEQVQELQSQLDSALLKMKRMKEAFVGKADQFRSACYRLFGYHIEMTGSDVYKVVSYFAESEMDYFTFRSTPNGEMLMIESEYSLQHTSEIEAHLGLSAWIPSFLASLTIELASKQTVLEASSMTFTSTMK